MENERFYVLQIEVDNLNFGSLEFQKEVKYITKAEISHSGLVNYETSTHKEDAFRFNQSYLRVLTMADSEFANKITVYQGNTSYKKLDRTANSYSISTGNYFNL
jgi:hypothetical protein|nr:MAG TPA: hypothetical protein [Caudoviricetes sp.]